MTTLIRSSLFLLLIAVPVSLPAQQGHTGEEKPTDPRGTYSKSHSGVGWLLRHRGDLGLTDRQIGRLETIARDLERRNRPLLRQLKEAGIPVHGNGHDQKAEMSMADKEELRKRLEAHKPTLHRLQANTRAAMSEAHEVLTKKQRDRLRAIMKRQQDARHEQEQDNSRRAPEGISAYGD